MKPNQVYQKGDIVLFGSEKRIGIVKAVTSRSITIKLLHSTAKVICSDITKINIELNALI